MQETLTYIALGLALAFLFRKYIFKGKNKGNCDKDCGC